jgi:hypothetical protein
MLPCLHFRLEECVRAVARRSHDVSVHEQCVSQYLDAVFGGPKLRTSIVGLHLRSTVAIPKSTRPHCHLSYVLSKATFDCRVTSYSLL